jgi:hypothetical protein
MPSEIDSQGLPARRPVKGAHRAAAQRRTLDGPRKSAGYHGGTTPKE